MLKDTNIVEKSTSLVWAQFQDYGIGELKILDTYLSRINAREPDSALVTFTKKEYAELIGVDPNIRISQMKAYTKGLLRNVVTIDDPNEGYVQYPLFSKAECKVDPKTGHTTITIRCHEELQSVFFNITERGYVRYQLKNVISMRSMFSIKLYNMLKAKHFSWTVTIDELRSRMGATAPTYNDFRRFNAMVLKKSIEEINAITDILVSAENIRTGRSVTSIKFTITEKTQVVLKMDDAIEAEEITEEDDYVVVTPEYNPDDPYAMFSEALPSNLTRHQVEELYNLAQSQVPYTVMNFHEKNLWIFDYLRSKTIMLQAAKDIEKPYAWLKAAVKDNFQ